MATEAVEAKAVQAEYVSGMGEDSVTFAKDKTIADAVWYEKDGTDALTEDEIKSMLEVDEKGQVVLKDDAELYKVAADTSDDNQYGDQKLSAQKVDDTDVQDVFTVGTSKISTKIDGSALVEADKLAELFNTDGSMKGALYAQNDKSVWTEIGVEQIDKFVNVIAGSEAVDAGEKEVEVVKALEFSLHVGAESDDTNKITVKIESMSAASIGVDVLSGDGVKTQDSATEAINIIKAAISKVSEQRSTLGAAQNRLEHTINNLDNVVENTTAAESQIRDTDMATEMVNYSNNNILAQAGQAMLAQSNQANQGVLSLLG